MCKKGTLTIFRMRLKGKNAVVTGAAHGIGLAISKMFLKEGANVCAGVHSDKDIKSLETDLPGALIIKLDVTDGKSVSDAISACIGKFGGVDILVNNAGVYNSSDFHETQEKDWNSVIDVDLNGVFRCTKAVLPSMLERGKGKIVNIASIAGLVGFQGSGAYCAAKGAVVNLTRELALEYAVKKINVNAICPGVIKTKMTDPFLNDPTMSARFKADIPYPRFGEPIDIAYLAVYLASDESDFMTGAVIPIDGGETCK